MWMSVGRSIIKIGSEFRGKNKFYKEESLLKRETLAYFLNDNECSCKRMINVTF